MKWYNIFLLLLITQLTACGTTLFRADFDSDAVGELPSSSPPEEPAGDRIWVASTESDEVRDAAVVISDGIDGKSLRYSNFDIPSLLREVRFFSIENNLDSDEYWAMWSGRIRRFTYITSPLDISFGNLQIGQGWLRIHLNQFWVLRSGASLGDPEAFEPIGPYSQRGRHTIVFKIDRTDSTYSVAVFQQGASDPALNIGPRPLPDPAGLEEQRLIINMRFEGEGHSEGRYVMDNVLITEREPEMMR